MVSCHGDGKQHESHKAEKGGRDGYGTGGRHCGDEKRNRKKKRWRRFEEGSEGGRTRQQVMSTARKLKGNDGNTRDH